MWPITGWIRTDRLMGVSPSWGTLQCGVLQKRICMQIWVWVPHTGINLSLNKIICWITHTLTTVHHLMTFNNSTTIEKINCFSVNNNPPIPLYNNIPVELLAKNKFFPNMYLQRIQFLLIHLSCVGIERFFSIISVVVFFVFTPYCKIPWKRSVWPQIPKCPV